MQYDSQPQKDFVLQCVNDYKCRLGDSQRLIQELAAPLILGEVVPPKPVAPPRLVEEQAEPKYEAETPQETESAEAGNNS